MIEIGVETGWWLCISYLNKTPLGNVDCAELVMIPTTEYEDPKLAVTETRQFGAATVVVVVFLVVLVCDLDVLVSVQRPHLLRTHAHQAPCALGASSSCAFLPAGALQLPQYVPLLWALWDHVHNVRHEELVIWSGPR